MENGGKETGDRKNGDEGLETGNGGRDTGVGKNIINYRRGTICLSFCETTPYRCIVPG